MKCDNLQKFNNSILDFLFYFTLRFGMRWKKQKKSPVEHLNHQQMAFKKYSWLRLHYCNKNSDDS